MPGAARRQRARAEAATPTDLVNGFLGAVQRGTGARQPAVQRIGDIIRSPFAARAADTLVAEYVHFNLEFRTDATRKSLDFLAGEIVKQQKKVEDSERAMAEYRETNNALSLEDRQNTVVASLNQVNDQYTRIRTRADSEGSALQPDQVAAAGGTGRLAGGVARTRWCRACAPGSPSCCARRCSSTNATARRIRR